MSRLRPDGVELRWTLTRRDAPGDGLVPFLIDWGDSAHPSRTAAAGCRLLALRAEHPEPDRIAEMLRALEVSLDVHHGPRPRLVARIQTSRGTVELA